MTDFSSEGEHMYKCKVQYSTAVSMVILLNKFSSEYNFRIYVRSLASLINKIYCYRKSGLQSF